MPTWKREAKRERDGLACTLSPVKAREKRKRIYFLFSEGKAGFLQNAPLSFVLACRRLLFPPFEREKEAPPSLLLLSLSRIIPGAGPKEGEERGDLALPFLVLQ